LLRFLVLLLVLPPLLMPPGVCVCQILQAGSGGTALVASESAAPTRLRNEVPSRANGCCKGCWNLTYRDTDSRGPQPDPMRGCPEPDQSVPSDRQHAPNCPAVGAVAAAKFAEPPIVLPVIEFVISEAICAGDVSNGPRAFPTSADTFPTTPRYISFRSLLI
jgi:hypothetical protein